MKIESRERERRSMAGGDVRTHVVSHTGIHEEKDGGTDWPLVLLLNAGETECAKCQKRTQDSLTTHCPSFAGFMLGMEE